MKKYKECVGCGYCCITAPCIASARLYPSSKICPQLIWNGDQKRYFCGLMTLPGKIGYEYKKELYAGEGCCSSLNNWRDDIKERTADSKEDSFPHIPGMFQAFLKAYSSEPFISNDTLLLILGSFRQQLKVINYSEDEIEHIVKNTIHYIISNKSSKFKGFMA